MHISCVFAKPMKEKSAENGVQAYLSGIFAHKGGSIAIFSDNGAEFKSTTVKKACDHLNIIRVFLNPFIPQGNSRIKNPHNFCERTLTKCLESSDLEWD